MRFITILIFMFLMSSFNISSPPTMNMENNAMSLSKMDISMDCHEEIAFMNDELLDNCMSCDTDCSTSCSTNCSQASSFIVTRSNNRQITLLQNLKLEILSQSYKSMTLSNLFRPPIV